MTHAEKFAATMGDDGQQWETSDGLAFDTVAAVMNAARVYGRSYADDDGNPHVRECSGNEHFADDPIRYVFPDGSAVVAAGDAWDLEGERPFTWKA